MVESRHTDTSPVVCTRCGWEGQVQDCKHGYTSVPVMQKIGTTFIPQGFETEPEDYCPACGSPLLKTIESDSDQQIVSNMKDYWKHINCQAE